LVIFAAATVKPLNQPFLTKAFSLIAIIFIGIILGNLLLESIARLYGLQIHSEDDLFEYLKNARYTPMIKIALGINHFIIFVCCPLLFLYIFYREDIRSFLAMKHFNPLYILLFPLALFTLYPLMGYIAYYVAKLDLPDFLIQMDQKALANIGHLMIMNNSTDLILNILLIGILPGIGEELLFRGVIQKEILKKWNRPHLAIWSTAIIFSAFHYQVIGFIPKMMIGLVLGYAFFYSGSLILPMVIHALNNILATVSFYFSGDNFNTESMPTENIPLSAVIFSTILFGWLMYFIISLSNQTPVRDE